MNDEPFQLRNEPPAPRPEQYESTSGRQTVLFAGLHCLPGQGDLFPTDGKERDDNTRI